MGSVCAEQHKFHHLFSSKNKTLDIPPRKLLSRKAAAAAVASPGSSPVDMFPDSPHGGLADASSLQKFLPYNSGDDSDDSDCDPYSSDHFRMFEFKVRRCTRSRSHDWTDCPFAHPGEKARRRDPRRYHYSGTVCAEFRRGSCSRGDNCEFAHGVFECWLHPSRYRTEACKDGKNCKRKVCFFAHTPRQLRILPVQPDSPSLSEYPTERKHRSGSHQLTQHCCVFCHHSQVSSSPTSTLMGMSHLSPPVSPSSQSLSPPLSPMKHRPLSGLSPISRYAERVASSESMSYKDVLNEIMGSLEVMNVNEASRTTTRTNLPWVDVSSFSSDDQPQFILSPVTPNPNQTVGRDSFAADSSTRFAFLDDQTYKPFRSNSGDGLAAASDPDLGWVNDLLM